MTRSNGDEIPERIKPTSTTVGGRDTPSAPLPLASAPKLALAEGHDKVYTSLVPY